MSHPRRTVSGVTESPAPTTLGALRDSGATHVGVKAELRTNLLARLAAGEPTLPGIVGFEDPSCPRWSGR